MYKITLCTKSPYVQNHPMYKITLCTKSPYVQYHPRYNITLGTISPYVQYHPMYNITLGTISPYVQYHPRYNITLCAISPYVKYHLILTSIPGRGEWTALSPSRFNPLPSEMEATWVPKPTWTRFEHSTNYFAPDFKRNTILQSTNP